MTKQALKSFPVAAPAPSPAPEFSEAARRKHLGLDLIAEMTRVTCRPARVREILKMEPSLEEVHPVDGRSIPRILAGYEDYAARCRENPEGHGKSKGDISAVARLIRRRARIAKMVNAVLFPPPPKAPRTGKQKAAKHKVEKPKLKAAAPKQKKAKPPKKSFAAAAPAARKIRTRAEMGQLVIDEMLSMRPNVRKIGTYIHGAADLTVADERSGRTLTDIIAEFRDYESEFARDPHARGESMGELATVALVIGRRNEAIAVVEPALRQQLAQQAAGVSAPHRKFS